MGPYGSYLVETVAMLAVVSGLAFFAMVVAKRLGVGRAHGPIELVGQLPLDARRGIYLVKVGGRVFLVGVGESGFTKLGEVAAAELPASEKPATSFSDVLARALNTSKKEAPSSEPVQNAIIDAPASARDVSSRHNPHDPRDPRDDEEQP